MAPRATTAHRLRFLAAVAVSAYGDWLTTVAVVVLLYRLTGTVTAPAVAILLRVVPRPFGAFMGGHLADRVGAIRALGLLSLCQGGMTALLAVAAESGSTPATLVMLLGCQGLGAAAQPAGLAAIPELVPPDSVGRLTAATSLIFSTSAVVAPAVAAGLLAVGSPVPLIGADAATFLVAASLIASLPRWPQTSRSGGRPELVSGIRLLVRHPLLRQLGAAQAGNFAVITALQAVLVAVAEQRFGTAAAAGWVYAAVGVGAAVGSLALMVRTPPRVGHRALAAATLLELLPLGAFTVVSSPVADLCLVGLSGFGAALYQVTGAAEVARLIEPSCLGQVNAAIALAGYMGMIVGGAGAVALATTVGWTALLQGISVVAAFGLAGAVIGADRSRQLPAARANASRSRMTPPEASHA